MTPDTTPGAFSELPKPADDYDVCIVGAGVAGSLIAEQLTAQGRRVAVIEAGRKWQLAERINQLRRFEILGEPYWQWQHAGRDVFEDHSKSELGYNYRLNDLRVKGVGGSTLHWGGLAQRLRPSDFETNSRYGTGVDWPISYADIEPYYCRAEAELGVSGLQNPDDPQRSQPFPMPAFPLGYGDKLWLPTLKKLGIQWSQASEARNSTNYRGRSQCVAYSVCRVCPSGARYSADFHTDRAVATGRCDLFTETTARRIETSAAGDVQKIHATHLSGNEFEVKAKRFVIAAHAIESARLLMLSKAPNESDQLGRNLQEHWYLGLSGYQNEQMYPGRIGFSTLESNHFYDGPEREQRGALKIEFGEAKHNTTKEQSTLWGDELNQFDCDHFGRLLHIGIETEHAPNPDSRITLSDKQKDLFGDPAPSLHFQLSPRDRKTFERGIEVARELLEARGVREIKQGQQYGPGGHHMGTCRMSSSAATGVVDPNSRVFGTSNLYCAGSSVFATSGARQPTLTIAALALRLADHLSGKDSQI